MTLMNPNSRVCRLKIAELLDRAQTQDRQDAKQRPQGISGGVIALFVVMGLLVVIPLLRRCCFGAKEMKAPLQPLQLQPATELSGNSQLYSPPPRT